MGTGPRRFNNAIHIPDSDIRTDLLGLTLKCHCDVSQLCRDVHTNRASQLANGSINYLLNLFPNFRAIDEWGPLRQSMAYVTNSLEATPPSISSDRDAPSAVNPNLNLVDSLNPMPQTISGPDSSIGQTSQSSF